MKHSPGGLKLLIHSRTSTIPDFNGTAVEIRGVWLLTHTFGIEVTPCSIETLSALNRCNISMLCHQKRGICQYSIWWRLTLALVAIKTIHVFKINAWWVNTTMDTVWTLQWRHNERDGVSNHQCHACFLKRLFRRRSKKHQISASLAFVRGIQRWPVNSPHKDK